MSLTILRNQIICLSHVELDKSLPFCYMTLELNNNGNWYNQLPSLLSGSLSSSFTKNSMETNSDNDLDAGNFLIDVLHDNHSGRFNTSFLIIKHSQNAKICMENCKKFSFICFHSYRFQFLTIAFSFKDLFECHCV